MISTTSNTAPELLPAHIKCAKQLYRQGYSVVNCYIYYDKKNNRKGFITPPNATDLTYEECNAYISREISYTGQDGSIKTNKTNGLMLLTGIRQGKADNLKHCICVDLDNPKNDEIDGKIFIEKYAHLFNNTYTETTANGGRHYIFTVDPNRFNNNKVFVRKMRLMSDEDKYDHDGFPICSKNYSIDILVNSNKCVLAPTRYIANNVTKQYIADEDKTFDDISDLPDELYKLLELSNEDYNKKLLDDLNNHDTKYKKQTANKSIEREIKLEDEYVNIYDDDDPKLIFIKLLLKNNVFKNMKDYSNWKDIGMVIKNEFGESGLDIFNQISMQYPNYKNKEDVSKYYWGFKSYKGKKCLKFGTIKKIVKNSISANQYETLNTEYNTILKAIKIRKDQLLKKNIFDYQFDKKFTNKFDIDYFHTLPNYDISKRYFELFHCKVKEPKVCYVTKYKTDSQIRHFQSTAIDFREKYINLYCYETNDKDGNVELQSVSFIKKWIGDPKIRTYNNADFIPYNGFDNNNGDNEVFNLFNGYNPAIKTPYTDEDKQTLVIFKDILFNLVGGCIKAYNYFYKFIADIIQNPNRKIPISIIIKSFQGCGKNTIFNIIASIISKEHFFTTSDINDVFGDHSEEYSFKLLLNLNEIDISQTYKLANRIKSFITEDTIGTNFKNIRCGKIRNVARLIFTSNNYFIVPIDISSGDRRFVLFESTKKYATKPNGVDYNKEFDDVFWTKFLEDTSKDSFIACLYDDLNSVDLSTVKWVLDRPLTEAYYEYCKINYPKELYFISDYIYGLVYKNGDFIDEDDEDNELDDNSDMHMVDCKTLYMLYQSYIKNLFPTKESCSINKFNSELMHLGVPIKRYRTKKGQFRDKYVYEFNKNELLEFIKERKL